MLILLPADVSKSCLIKKVVHIKNPDWTRHSGASDLGLLGLCLLRSVDPNSKLKHGN